MISVDITLGEALEIWKALGKLIDSGTQLPNPFSWRIARNKRVLDRAEKDYRSALEKSNAGVRRQRFYSAREEFWERTLKKSASGQYLTRDSGSGQDVIPKDPDTFDHELEEFWKEWPNANSIEREYKEGDERLKSEQFEDQLYEIKYKDIPDSLPTEYKLAIDPLVVDWPEDFAERQEAEAVKQIREAAD